MKKYGILLILPIAIQSCLPIRIAPNIDDYKIMKGRRFKKNLPIRQMFLFEDPKDAGHFYDFVNTKFGLDDKSVYDDVPFILNDGIYFFSFYEVEKPTKIINLGGVFVDAMLDEAGMSPIFTAHYESRKEQWYIAIEVYSDTEKDCLLTDALSREVVLKYLRVLKQEYLTTHNYNETVFRN